MQPSESRFTGSIQCTPSLRSMAMWKVPGRVQRHIYASQAAELEGPLAVALDVQLTVHVIRLTQRHGAMGVAHEWPAPPARSACARGRQRV